jgi:hypothetical protein
VPIDELRLRELRALQATRPLTPQEWRQCAVHLRALGNDEEAATAERTAIALCTKRLRELKDLQATRHLTGIELDECFVNLRALGHDQEATKAEQAAIRQHERERQAAEQEEKQKWASINTGLGSCPSCGSTNIIQFTTGGQEKPSVGRQLLMGSLAVTSPEMMLLASMSNSARREQKQYHRRCASCGHQWLC